MTTTDAHIFRADKDAFPIDRARLADYLEKIDLPLDPAEPILQFGTGLANINYRLKAGGQMLVLRRPPDGDLPPGAHDMSREHRILSRLWRALPLAPRSVHLCEDRGVIGAPFQLIDYRPGLVIKGDDKRYFEGRPEVAARTGKILVETLVAIHDVDADAVGLGSLGKPEGFIERTRSGWTGRAERLELEPATAALVRDVSGWLARQSVQTRKPTLLHSDFKLDNLILGPDTLKPVAIVDWDMGTRGDPLFDVATLVSYWAQRDDPACMHDMRQLPTASPGFPTREEIVEAYARLTGRDVSDFPVLRVLAMFKLAVVLLQLHALWKRGAAKGDDYARFGEIATELLVFSWDAAAGRA